MTSTPPLSAYERAMGRTLAAEGKATNDPEDSGGPTGRGGITHRTKREAIKAGILPGEAALRDLTDQEIRDVYTGLFWDAARCYDLPGYAALAVFDQAITSGVPKAVKTLQIAVRGVKVDGIIGPKTIDAVFCAEPLRLVVRLIAAREAQLHDLAARRTKDRKYLRGWLNRTEALERDCLELAA